LPLTKRVTLRLTPEGFRRLEAIAATRGVDPSRALRQLVDEADVDAPAKPRDKLSEEQLLELLRERAQDGNVAAIVRLLEIERTRDPRAAAIAALERMTKGRES
jgi:hypothetical protein